MIKSVAIFMSLLGSQSIFSVVSIRKLASRRIKMRYSSRMARRWPAHILYPRPNAKMGASGRASHLSGSNLSGSGKSSGSKIELEKRKN